MSNIKTVREYMDGNNTFVIPNYQRGYKWGVPDSNGNCAVSVLMDDLITAFKNEAESYFLQGVTVTEKENEIILIDGQQRTTTLFLLLKYLNYKELGNMVIKYDIRTQSSDFLKSLQKEDNLIAFCKEGKEDFQDIFYFKKAIRTIDDKIKAIDNEAFTEFLLKKVNMLYIKINEDKATKVFSMMNGNKALMKDEELIKAELLRLIAKRETKEVTAPNTVEEALIITSETFANEWDINALRSKYAREWDKWLYWWNDDAVSSFFNPKNTPLGLLIKYYFDIQKEKNDEIKKLDFSFDNFKKDFLKDTKAAKDTFAGLRKLQKNFEDLYNDVECYNYLGLTLQRKSEKFEAIKYFIDNKNSKDELKDYAKWSLVGATHKEIISTKKSDNEEITKESRASDVFNNLSSKIVYGSFNEDAALQLLQLNVIADNTLQRKFDFSIYDKISLEHIHSKSFEEQNDDKSWKYEKNKLDFSTDLDISEHCIGNLAILKLNDNSSFNNSCFEDKKKIYFNLNNIKHSLVLIHTLSLFTNEKWDKVKIRNNQTKFIDDFKKYYGI